MLEILFSPVPQLLLLLFLHNIVINSNNNIQYFCSNCKKLTSVSFNCHDSAFDLSDSNAYPSSNFVFQFCPNITNFYIGKNANALGHDFCYKALAAITLVIPDNIVHVDNQCFYGSGIKILEDYASYHNSFPFKNCPNLEKVTFKNPNLELSTGCFEGCNNIKNVNFDSKVKKILQVLDKGTIDNVTFTYCLNTDTQRDGDPIFNRTGQDVVTIKNLTYGINKLNGNALQNAHIDNLIVLEGTIELSNINSGNNSDVVNIKLPNTLKNMASCFSNNNSLTTNVKIPNSVTTIYSCFCDNNNLNEVDMTSYSANDQLPEFTGPSFTSLSSTFKLTVRKGIKQKFIDAGTPSYITNLMTEVEI